MSQEIADFYAQWPARLAKARSAAPDAIKAFGSLFAAVMKDGALSLREKELIALAVGLALRCDPCVNLHVQKSLEAGATREQIMETAAVVVMMQGGPAYTYLPKVVEVLEALESKSGG
jgi:AhpD family alkylhydroperoxidase